MPVFAVVAGKNSSTSLMSDVTNAYDNNDRISLDNGNWLVFEEKLLMPKDVCDKLIGVGNLNKTLLVVPVDSYWGVHDNAVWAWLTSKKL